jgi:hypothetical protein
MCPACLTTLALIAAGVTSTGGVTTLVVSRFRRKNDRNQQTEIDRDRRETWSIGKGISS